MSCAARRVAVGSSVRKISEKCTVFLLRLDIQLCINLMKIIEKGELARRYSALSLIREGLNGQRGWEPAWRDAKPKAEYDAVIIGGGGGHGLATAYYLAKNHGMTNIAVIERDGLGAETPAATPP